MSARWTLEDEEGSTLPLVLGYALLAVALILVCVDATSLYLGQKRLDGLADAAALAAADGFELTMEGDAPRVRLDEIDARAQALEIVEAARFDDTLQDPRLVSVDVGDAVSATVTVAGAWHPPLFSPFVPDGVPLQGRATSRNALD